MKTNTPNPLVPQGTFPSHRKSHVRIAVFSILALHLILLGALLLQGCKRTADSGTTQQTNASMTPEFDQATNVLAVAPAPLPVSQVEVNPVVASHDTPPPPTPMAPSPQFIRNPQVTHTIPYVPPVSNQPAEPAGAASTHVVLKGESFFTIGKKYGVSSKAIARANPRVDARSLKVGEKLTIPAAPPAALATPAPGNLMTTQDGSVYVVKSGDNLSKIAKDFGTTVAALRSANALKSDKLKVGDKLKIPAAAHANSATGVRADTSTSSVPRYP